MERQAPTNTRVGWVGYSSSKASAGPWIHPKRKRSTQKKTSHPKFEMDYCHCFKNKTPSSTLTRNVKQLAVKVAREKCTVQKSRNRGKWRKRTSRQRRMLQKYKKLAALPRVNLDVGKDRMIRKQDLMRKLTFFSGTESTQINGIPTDVIQNATILSAPRDLVVLDNPDGLHMPGVFTLVPRQTAMEAYPKCFLSKVYDGLEYQEKLNNRSTARAKGVRVVCHETPSSYVTFGTNLKLSHQGLGHHLKHLNQHPQHHANVGKFAHIVEQLGVAYMDTESLHAVQAIREVSQYPGMDCGDGTETKIWPSVSCGRNVYLSAHTDDDFFLSVTSVVTKSNNTTGATDATEAICNYFCFPEQGVCVALRSGDILLFNPLVYHCVSSRSDTSQDVYCLSMYLKTAVVGGNDNGGESNGLHGHKDRPAVSLSMLLKK